jgi:hypothetical protein
MNGNIMQRKCGSCNQDKDILDFYISKTTTYCKECTKERVRAFRVKNRIKLSIYFANRYQQNRKQIIKKAVEYEAKMMKTNPLFKLKKLMRTRLRMAIKNSCLGNKQSYKEYIGCSIEYLKQHLELKFTPAMNWGNHGLVWHIDHIVPLSRFNLSNDCEIKQASHYSNLQPLTALDNLKKGNR